MNGSIAVARSFPRVRVRVSSLLTCEHFRNALPDALVGAVVWGLSCVWFVLWSPLKVLKMFATLSAFFVFDSAYLFLDHLACVLFLFVCLLLVLCCVFAGVLVEIRRVRWSWLCCRGVDRFKWLTHNWSWHLSAYR